MPSLIGRIRPLAWIMALTMGLGSAALAEDVTMATVLEAVTVFPTGAEVSRSGTVSLKQGEHNLQIPLPPGIQPNSIQIEGRGGADMTINALDLAPAPGPDAAAEKARVAEIGAGIDRLTEERRRYVKAADNAVFALELIRTLALRKMQPEGANSTPPVPEPSALTGLLDTVDARLSQATASLLEAQARTEAIDRQITELRAELARPITGGKPGWIATVRILVGKPGEASFVLRYRVAEASWQPLYEARLTTEASEGGANLELVRNAVVTQTTDEDWTDVALTLSTAQRTSAISAPVLKSQSLDSFSREIEQVQAAEAAAASELSGGEIGQGSGDGQGKVTRTEAAANSLGFNVLYSIPGRVTINRDGADKTVRIGSGTGAAELFLQAVPKLDLTAYLGARFRVDVGTPLLAGQVMLFRDGIFVGESILPLTSQGDQVTLSFGADDLVTIERLEVDRRSGETGLVSTAYIEERSFVTRIFSSHGFSIPITIQDQVPYSSDDRIRVDLLEGTTSSDLGEVEGTKGIYAWTKVLEPQVPQEIRFGFRVTWPKGLKR